MLVDAASAVATRPGGLADVLGIKQTNIGEVRYVLYSLSIIALVIALTLTYYLVASTVLRLKLHQFLQGTDKHLIES